MNVQNQTIRIAILDLYEGKENQGMRCLHNIVKDWSEEIGIDVELKVFDVRLKNEVPDLGFDTYISTGGPGSPLDTVGTIWEERYFNWVQEIEEYNANPLNENKKHVFFICHSFQLICRHYGVGEVCKRRSTSFGVFPIHMLEGGLDEIIFEGLNDPFFAVDSREFQVISGNAEVLQKMGGTVLAIEKERPHIPLERALMAIRFNEYFFGTQFHPEADAVGMKMYLEREDKKKAVIDEHGEEKWKSMIEHLQDPDKILFTYEKILPNFLNQAISILV